MYKTRNIAVLMGGVSSEREVSLRSGTAVSEALKQAGHNVICIEVNDEKVEELDRHEIDVAFIALHGYFGEDGGIQSLLESKGIPYTGSGVEASRIAMDKIETKRRFLARGLSTPDYVSITQYYNMSEVQRFVDMLGFPVIVKPARNGSSIGVSMVKNLAGLKKGIEKALKFGSKALIEKHIHGKELTVGILGNNPLPIIEIKPAVEFFDYTAKYNDSRTEYNMEVSLPSSVYNEVQQVALKAHETIGCKGFSRVDMILEEQNHGPNGLGLASHIYLLEINTIPGFTEKSLLPKAARAANIGFVGLCETIVEFALQDVEAGIEELV
ncbi:MAG: D-alanine--D-alanine ligase [Planctomycetes bacterium]|nr:D-alanine--D-alanine ligase [Planctomycetota bacterium]MBI4008375.1 D-alanine--D-alanine ligase [Planctomycetota bacterium]